MALPHGYMVMAYTVIARVVMACVVAMAMAIWLKRGLQECRIVIFFDKRFCHNDSWLKMPKIGRGGNV